MIAVQPLIAVSFSLSFVGQSRLLAASVPADQQSSAQTLGSAVSFGFGSLLAGVLGGHLADAAGYGALFAAMGVVSLVGAGIGAVALWRSAGRGRSARAPRPVEGATPGSGAA
jgi:MFS family permease